MVRVQGMDGPPAVVTPPPPPVAGSDGMGWRTIAGALIWALGFLLDNLLRPEVLSQLPERAATILQAVGAVLAVFGLRRAQSKTQAAAIYAAVELGTIKKRLGV